MSEERPLSSQKELFKIRRALVDGVPVSEDHVHEPSADTAAIVTLPAAGAGVSNILGLVNFSYDSDPTGGSLTIEDGAGSTIFKTDITRSGPGPIEFVPPKRGTANTAMIITLAAGGGSVSGIVSVHAWTG